MTDPLWTLLVGTALVNNVVLVQFLGLCPFMGVSRQLDAALGMGAATAFVLTLSAGLSHLIERWVLMPLEIEVLRTLAFIVAIGVVVQFTELVIRRRMPRLYRMLGLYLPLITTNCAVLGIALLGAAREQALFDALFTGFAAALGFTLVLVLFAALRERLATADIPAPFAGTPVALITAGVLSLAFLGFAGLDSP